MFLNKTSMLLLLLVAMLAFGCSSSDNVTNTDLTTGDLVTPDEITVPADLQAAADAGDEGAQAIVQLIQGIDDLDSLSTMMQPPPQATVIGAPAFAPTADSTWQWDENGVTYTLTFSQTSTDYQWELVADGSTQVFTYDNFTVAEMTEAKNGSSGSFAMYFIMFEGLSMSFDWTATSSALTLNMFVGTDTEYVQMNATVNADGSGQILVYDGTALAAKVEWTSNGNGQWWNYDTSENGSF